MIKDKMVNALNKHLNKELYSWYLYLAMSSQFEYMNFPGAAKWLRVQAQEELNHALKFIDYLNQVNAVVAYEPIEKPKGSWNSFEETFQQIYDHEVAVTESIDDLVNIATAERDHATNAFLQWFVNEQVEEVATADQLLQRIKFIGGSHGGLAYFDHQLGKRG